MYNHPVRQAEVRAVASKAKHNTSEISWRHPIVGGADTAVVVAVSFKDLSGNNNHIVPVKLGGAAMRPVPDSLAALSGWRARTTTQLFYLSGVELARGGGVRRIGQFHGEG